MALKYLKVTMTGSAVQITSAHTPITDVQFQNNATHTITIGNSSVATGGIVLGTSTTAGAGGTLYMGPFPQRATNLDEFWAIGTNNDTLDVLYNT